MSIVNNFLSVEDYCGSLSFTGTYANSTYFTSSGCYIASNIKDNTLLIIIKGGSSLDYENVVFSLASAPSGVGLITSSAAGWGAAVVSAGQYYCAILTGVTQKLNISCDFNAIDATNDYVVCAITATSA